MKKLLMLKKIGFVNLYFNDIFSLKETIKYFMEMLYLKNY
jgi:hypothetical protein